MFTVHHLQRSQSERIVWLCEELGLDYELTCYARDPVTILAPPEYKALHPVGSAPVIVDGDVVLAESGAVVDYLLALYGAGRLAHGPAHPRFADYLYWLHYANGTLQPGFSRLMYLRLAGLAAEHPVRARVEARVAFALGWLDQRVAANEWLAGDDFTAADVMSVFSLTTMRSFVAFDLAPFPALLAYLQRIGARPAYARAMAKGDPAMTPWLT
ncbi:MAG: glutathione S-transferase family protein [Pseudomonadota bacterium]